MSTLQAFEATARQQLLARRLADRAVAADVETGCPATTDEQGRKWYDTRPLVDEREHASQVIDMAREALEYGLKAGVLIQHQTHAWLVRVDQRRLLAHGGPSL